MGGQTALVERNPLFMLTNSEKVFTNLVVLSRRGHHFTGLLYIGVTRSRKIESDRDYQKNKERVQELKVLWKMKRLHSTINKYTETFDINTITNFYLPNSHL